MKKKIFSTVLFVLFLAPCVGVPLGHAADSEPLAVNVDINPDSISLKEQKGSRITCTVTLPAACMGATIDAKSVTLGHKIVADSVTTCKNIAIIKFNRSDISILLKMAATKSLPRLTSLSKGISRTENLLREIIPLSWPRRQKFIPIPVLTGIHGGNWL